MDNVDKHISATYVNADWHAGCNHIPWGDWHVMVDEDNGKIRIGAYEMDAIGEYAEHPTIWIEIPEDREDLAITTLELITESLATIPASSH